MEKFVCAAHPPQRISRIRFGMMGAEEMRRAAHVLVGEDTLYKPNCGVPIEGGALDSKLGVSNKGQSCKTCGRGLADCPGHFGVIELQLPCFNIGNFKATMEVLQRVCKSCCRILMNESEIERFLPRFSAKMIDIFQRRHLRRSIGEICKKRTVCPHCGAFNGAVKKVGSLKLVHEVFKVKNNDGALREFQRDCSEAIQHNKELEQYISRAQDDLTPIRALDIFKRIPAHDVVLLDMDPEVGRPEKLVLTHLLVPPVTLRPSVVSAPVRGAGGKEEDDLTSKLMEIIHINNLIRSSMEKGALISTIMYDWEILQLQVAMYMNSELPGYPSTLQGKRIRSLCSRLKGKRGRFRGNLSGKRVDFSARTVISPDPNVAIEEVVIPLHIARVLTFPENVTEHNMNFLRKCVLNGPDVHPGANFVEFRDSTKTFLKYGRRDLIAKKLKIGDAVERHLNDGDYVLFNRQPSLHRISIMCHRVKVLPNRTFRFNTCCCKPYNADFDGDEMNVHVPQTQESRAEAAELLKVTRNLLVPKNGELLVAGNQDFLSGSYLLSKKGQFFDKAHFCQLVSHMGLTSGRIRIPLPAIEKPVQLWTGKQVFSVLFGGFSENDFHLNLEGATRNYSGQGQTMCANDGYVLIRNDELLSGALDKKFLGDGSKNSVFYILVRDRSPEYAAESMMKLSKLISRFLMEFGFSFGISDVTPSDGVTQGKNRTVSNGYDESERNIEMYNKGKLELQPGCDMEQSLEAILNKLLSQLREKCGQLCMNELDGKNSALVMAISGAKGSNINISQMLACVGQQTVGGSRIPEGFWKRSLPHFPMESKAPEARGFVESSFFNGLSAPEFFFHTVSGREGLVDTAVKTAETGYMQRRLVKALEDLCVQYDGTVRNADDVIIQFVYGDDGLNPLDIETGHSYPVNLERLMRQIQNSTSNDGEECILPCNIPVIAKSILETYPNVRKTYVDDIIGMLERNARQAKNDAEVMKLTDFESPSALLRSFENIHGISLSQLRMFVDQSVERYNRAKVHAGETVGALAAQSIGEPGTQMTLKTFHFAGVASMNVTLGVPRVKEIINATKKIATPIISAELTVPDNVQSAKIVKAKVEKTVLGEICEYIREVISPDHCYLVVKVDLDSCRRSTLDITLDEVREAMIRAPKLKLDGKHVRLFEHDCIGIYPVDTTPLNMFHSLQSLKMSLPHIILRGCSTVNRAVISRQSNSTYKLLVEGTDLLAVMGTPGIEGSRTRSNDIMETASVLGIEAARTVIMEEIQFVLGSYGLHIDSRHVKLLADLMTFKGSVLGITRFGIDKMKDSVLTQASFEKTVDHLFEASTHSTVDRMLGVTERIIAGCPVPVGTGMFRIVQEYPFSFL